MAGNEAYVFIALIIVSLASTALALFYYRRLSRSIRELKINSTRYQKVFNAGRDAIIIFRFSDFRITDANSAALQLYGYSAEEFKRLTVYDLSAEVEKTHAFLSKAVSNDFFPQICFRKHRRKNGESFSAEIVIGSFVVGEEKFIIGGIRNISQSLKTIESLELARFSLDKAGDGAFWISQAGNIKYANEAACQSLEYSRDEVLTKTIFDFTPGLTYAAWIEFWNQVKDNAFLTYDSVHQTKSGRVFPVEKSAKILNYQDKEHICIFCRDISERKRAQGDLAKYAKDLEVTKRELELNTIRLEKLVVELKSAKQKAEQATQAKSEFLANVSHELRTPLTAILGFAQILGDDFEKPSNKQSIDVIMRNGNYLLQLLNDILDLSKIEAGKINLEMQRCSPVEIIQDVISLMHVRSDAKGLKILLNNTTPIPNEIETDPLRFRQILINLISNAVKFTELGSIEIVLEYINNEQSENGNLLKIKVIDTGIGIPRNFLENIFQPFYQLDNSNTRKFGGSGLGLAISKRFSNLLGGELVADSSEGIGSTFQFTINCGEISQQADFITDLKANALRNPLPCQSYDHGGRSLHNLNILLVEDGPDNQKLFRHYLEKAGARVKIAGNGQEALHMVLGKDDFPVHTYQNYFDLILMDIQMPVLDGYEATRRIRKAGIRIPILALTAHAMIDEGKKFFEVGCDDFITKPIFEEAFVSKVYTCANLKRTEATPQREYPRLLRPLTSARGRDKFSRWHSELDTSADPSLKKLLDQFIENLPSKANAIHQAFQDRDVDKVRLLAHQLVGASGGYGLKNVMHKAKSLEESCALGVNHPKVSGAVQALYDECSPPIPQEFRH